MAGFSAALHAADGYAVVSVAGELDMSTAATLRGCLEQAHSSGVRLVLLDCAALSFIDSSGLGVLIGAHKRLALGGGRLVLANYPPRLERPLRITGLSDVIPTHLTDAPVRPWDQAATAHDVLTAVGLAGVVPEERQPDRDLSAST